MPDIPALANDYMHACFGLKAFDFCAYDPARPYSVYFSLGEGIGALAFTLAVQQLLKPIYRFRLAVRGLSLARLYSIVFAGAAAVLIAAIVPSVPLLHGSAWGYAIVWEVIGALLFAVAYAAVVLAVVYPVRARAAQIPFFARTAATLLSASEQDHIDFATDLQHSLPGLINAASFMDYLRNTSAFFDFQYRRELEQASYASSFLRIVADPAFCETLVKRSPWRLVYMLQEISEKKLHARPAEQFIRELAHQAILRDDGMMAREVGYHGFGTAPLLSDNLFSDPFIIDQYNPFNSFFTLDSDAVTPSMMKRFNSAAERCFITLIETESIYHSQASFSIQQLYQSAFMRAWYIQKTPEYDYRFPLQMHNSVELAIKMAERLLAKATPIQYQGFFVVDPKQFRSDVLETLVEIVYEALAAISNRFKGFDDAFWMTGIEAFMKAFPAIGQQPDGMTPFQQRLALKIIDKLSDNMKGFYPAICRVLLACVGPYERRAAQPNRTAFNILKDAMYHALLEFPTLAASKPDKVPDYLPDNVTYDASTTALIQTYRGGGQVTTILSTLAIPPISLIGDEIRSPPTQHP